MKNYTHVIPSVVVALMATACGGGTGTRTGRRRHTPVPAIITVDGSSTVFPISEAVAEEFQKRNPGTKVTVGLSGTGGGFQKFCRGETAISDASRPISAAEIDACQKTGVNYIELPVAYDGLAVVVNPKNTWASSMTVAELRTLWSPEAQGKVLRWNQVRPSLAGSGDSSVRRGRRFGDVRLLYRGHQRKGESEPRRLHLQRRRQRSGAGSVG